MEHPLELRMKNAARNRRPNVWEANRRQCISPAEMSENHRFSVRKRSTKRSAVVRSARSWTLWRFRAPDVR